jgi:uncharacterized protein (TIGR00661 family)
MKVLFIIQGEGRGHQTQALALSQILNKNDHQVVLGLVGCNEPEKIPILLQNSEFCIETFKSPTLAFREKSNELSILKTIKNSLPYLGAYFRSIKKIQRAIDKYQPDLIINFYDFLGGIAIGLSSSKAKTYCVGHQYLLLNKNFIHPKGNSLDKLIVNFNTKITSLGSGKLLALSFCDFKNDKNIVSVPPLIREEVKLLKPSKNNFFLAYFTQWEMAKKMMEIAKCFPEHNFEVFINKDIESEQANLRFNKISATLFLQKMAACKGVISTAGFESVCESMHLEKPVLMVPIAKHYEQYCNAIDAERSKAGIFAKELNVESFKKLLEFTKESNTKDWINKTEEMFLKELDLSPIKKLELEAF